MTRLTARMPEYFDADDFIPLEPFRCFIRRDWIRPYVGEVLNLREYSLVPALPSKLFEATYEYKPGLSTFYVGIAEKLSPAEISLDESAVDAYLKKTATYKKARIFGDIDQKVVLQIRRDAIINAIKAEDAVARLNSLGVPVTFAAWEKMITRDRAAVIAAEKTTPLSVLTKAGLLKLAAEFAENTKEFLEAVANGYLPRVGRTETIEDFKHRHRAIFKHRHRAIFDTEGHFQGFQRSQFSKGRLARRRDFAKWADEKYKPDESSHAVVAMSDGYRAPRSSDEYAVWYATLAPYLCRLVAEPEPPRWTFQVAEKKVLPDDLIAELDLRQLMSAYPIYSEKSSRTSNNLCRLRNL